MPFRSALPFRPPARPIALLALLSALGPAACATGGTIDDTTGTGGTTTRPTGSGGEGGEGGEAGATTTSATGGEGGGTTTGATTTPTSTTFTASACPAGWFATGLDFEQKLVCSPIAAAARDAIHGGCSLYLGWRDECTGCNLPPTKWGRTSPAGCANGVGADNTCTEPTLDGTKVQLFGLSPDGDVNDDDKIHLGFHCPAPADTPAPGPCTTGSFATSLEGDTTTCIPAAVPVLDHVRTRCSLYFGWRDACDGCTSAPDRWGRVGPTGCTIGLGGTSTCTTPTLGGEAVQLFGLSTGGDVDGNDKLYLALHCDAPPEASTTTKGTCPVGQLITAVEEDGTLTCESPATAIADYFDQHCTAYFGLRDSCNACTDPPSKWGRLRNGFCTNDNGVDNTCTQTILGGKTLEMFGLNPDGDVNGDDKLYTGFRCD